MAIMAQAPCLSDTNFERQSNSEVVIASAEPRMSNRRSEIVNLAKSRKPELLISLRAHDSPVHVAAER